MSSAAIRDLQRFYAKYSEAGAASKQGAAGQGSARTFVNPVYEGADPFVYKHTDGFYYFCQSEGDYGIAIWKSDRLTDKGVKRVVWTAPEEGWNTSEVWAPELHFLDGKWYIYYAADSGENKDHRMGVLESGMGGRRRRAMALHRRDGDTMEGVEQPR